MVTNCPICSSHAEVAYPERIDPRKFSEFTYSSRKRPELMHYEYRVCQECELLFSANVPDAGNLLHAYQAAAFNSEIESRFAARTYRRVIRTLLNHQVRVLDVGCGDGAFLAECNEIGVKSFQGIEPSPAAADRADRAVRPSIFVGGHEEFQSDQQFDLITLFQTVEHLTDPIGFFRSMKDFAAPGALLAVACHNYRSPVNRLLGQRSPIFDIEHLQIFSHKSISAALQKAGLEIVSIKAYANTYPLSYWLRLSPLGTSLIIGRKGRQSWLASIPLNLRVGNVMAVGRFPR